MFAATLKGANCIDTKLLTVMQTFCAFINICGYQTTSCTYFSLKSLYPHLSENKSFHFLQTLHHRYTQNYQVHCCTWHAHCSHAVQESIHQYLCHSRIKVRVHDQWHHIVYTTQYHTNTGFLDWIKSISRVADTLVRSFSIETCSAMTETISTFINI